MKCRIVPGSVGAACDAIAIFGKDRVDVGGWMSPVYVNDVEQNEFKPAQELMAELGYKLEEVL